MAGTSDRALYLAWRPRTFDDVVGQSHCVQTLRNAVKNGTLAHAYLFSGPRGTGKTSMARLLFKAVNCLESRDGTACESCALCTSANAGRALDLIEMDAASNRGIDDVRELRDKINYAPAEARYRVYILDEAHQLTQPAWDALLKTLEEPPPHAILVLATTEAHKVPATVLSRCQRFDFHRISATEIRDQLARIAQREGLEVEPTVLSWLARAARGGLRDAISLLDQLRAFSEDRIGADVAREVLGLAGLETVRPFLEALEEDRAGDALEELNTALERGTDLRVYVGDALAYLRALLLLRYGAGPSLRAEFPAEEIKWLEQRATEWEAGRLRALVGGFGDALARFREPTQLLVQVELVLLTGLEAPDSKARDDRRLAADDRRRTTDDRPPTTDERRRTNDDGGTTADDGRTTTEERQLGEPAAASTARTVGDEPGAGEVVAALEPTADDRPPLQLADVRSRWAQIQSQIANTRADQFWFHRCDLHGVEGGTVVLKLEAGLRGLLEDRGRRLSIERELSQALDRPVRVRIVEGAGYVAEGEGASATPEDRPPSDDPVIRAGLRLFGGPLQAVSDTET